MLYIFSLGIKEGKVDELQRFIKSKSKQFADVQPKGWRLRGIYLTAFGFGNAAAEIHWEVDSYAAFDNATAAAKDGGPWSESLSYIYTFLDTTSAHGRLLKSIDDAVLVC